MELQHVNVKIYVEGELKVDPARFIEIFHRWIRDEVMDELLIDVADYRHVPNGPGVMLIGFESDYSLNHSDGHYGLLYNRKNPFKGSNRARFAQAFGSALKACQLLEQEFSGDDEPLAFSREAFELFINDRALAPNNAQTLATVPPELEAFLKNMLGVDNAELEPLSNDPRCRFGVRVSLPSPFDLSATLQKLPD